MIFAASKTAARAAGAAAAACLAVLLCSCAGIRFAPRGAPAAAELPPQYPSARFAVFSDPHLYDPALGVEGTAFQKDMDSDRKLLPESREILSAAIERVAASGVDFLLVPGDLTKDGERQNHLLMAEQLAALSRAGVRVFVVPGNHDVLNPRAVRYHGSARTRVPSVTPSEFAEIYREAGYGDALFRDPASLSYVAEPVAGLWLLAVDSARYADNTSRSGPRAGSGLTQARVDWIESMLRLAAVRRKAVIAMMHHGVVEHFKGQEKQFPDYLLSGWRNAADMLASYGVSAVFTGHFHAQDIALRRTPGGRTIYDVQTGSLVTFPDPVRLVSMDAGTQRMTIASSFITELPSYVERGVGFWDYSRQFVEEGAAKIAARVLARYGVTAKESATVCAQIAAALSAHFRGDEHFTGNEMITTKGLSPWAELIVGLRRELVESLWQDTEPPDNDLVIDLATGGWAVPAPGASAPTVPAPDASAPAVLGPGAAYDPARASSSSASRARGTVSSGFTLYHAR